jgi:hypothetical protein
MMNKKGPQAVKEFTMSAYNQFGMHVVVLVAFVDTEGDPSITLWVQASIHVHFSQSQAVLITTTKMVGHLSRAIIKTGGSTKCWQTSQNGALSPLVRAYSAPRKMTNVLAL